MKNDKEYWTTKNGRKIKLEDMTTNHIKNCISLLERNARKGQEIVYCYGWGDSDYIEGGIEVLYGDEYLKRTKYDGLKDELVRRKLKNDN